MCEYKLLTPPSIIFFSQGLNMGVVLHQLERQRQSKEMEQLVSPTSNVTTTTIIIIITTIIIHSKNFMMTRSAPTMLPVCSTTSEWSLSSLCRFSILIIVDKHVLAQGALYAIMVYYSIYPTKTILSIFLLLHSCLNYTSPRITNTESFILLCTIAMHWIVWGTEMDKLHRHCQYQRQSDAIFIWKPFWNGSPVKSNCQCRRPKFFIWARFSQNWFITQK